MKEPENKNILANLTLEGPLIVKRICEPADQVFEQRMAVESE